MNRDLEILQKMAQEAAEATGIFAKALDHIKNNRYTYGGAGIGALAGGAGAALATKNKKNRLRNTLLGALGGGAAGAGVGYMGQQNSNRRAYNDAIYEHDSRLLRQQNDEYRERIAELENYPRTAIEWAQGIIDQEDPDKTEHKLFRGVMEEYWSLLAEIRRNRGTN